MQKSFLAALLAAVAALLIAAPFVNDRTAQKTADALARVPLPDKTEYIESVSGAGKWVGSGNGMQYFGAILLKSALPPDELLAYYAARLDGEEGVWDCAAERQTGAAIRVLEHGALSFQTDCAGEDYAIVYAWGTNPTVFHHLDLRGH